MIIPARLVSTIWGVTPDVLIHVGAHEAEELDDYRALGWGTTATIWVDALPEKVDIVREKVSGIPGHRVVNAVLWDASGETVEFNETSSSAASSALDLKDSKEMYQNIVVTRVREFVTSRADEALPLAEFDSIGLLLLDVQGAELHVLRGFGDQLDKVQAIYSEVNEHEIYAGGAIFRDLDAWLAERGFVLADAEVLWGARWGDALWLRPGALPDDAARRRRRRRLRGMPGQVKHILWWYLKRPFMR